MCVCMCVTVIPVLSQPPVKGSIANSPLGALLKGWYFNNVRYLMCYSCTIPMIRMYVCMYIAYRQYAV